MLGNSKGQIQCHNSFCIIYTSWLSCMSPCCALTMGLIVPSKYNCPPDCDFHTSPTWTYTETAWWAAVSRSPRAACRPPLRPCTLLPSGAWWCPDLIFVIFSPQMYFLGSIFLHMKARKLWQNLPKIFKNSLNFPKISPHDNFFSTNIIWDIFDKYKHIAPPVLPTLH